MKLGEVYSSIGNLEKALSYFERYHQLSKELYGTYPSNVDFKNDLAISFMKLYSINIELKNIKRAKKYLSQAEKHFAELHQIAPQYAAFKHNLGVVIDTIQKMES